MRQVVAVITALVAVGLSACSSPTATATKPTTSSLLSLRCSDSVGQQGRGGETVIGGVEGLVLPGSGDPAGLYPVKAADGRQYYIYKAFLAVSAAVAPYATVSVVRPAGTTLVYGSSTRIGDLMSAPTGQALIAASRGTVRLPVCGPRFTGFVGGIIVTRAACVTFAVSSRSGRPATVSVPIGPGHCAGTLR